MEKHWRARMTDKNPSHINNIEKPNAISDNYVIHSCSFRLNTFSRHRSKHVHERWKPLFVISATKTLVIHHAKCGQKVFPTEFCPPLQKCPFLICSVSWKMSEDHKSKNILSAYDSQFWLPFVSTSKWYIFCLDSWNSVDICLSG